MPSFANCRSRLEKPDVKIEVRNQARVHLWYPEKHGLPYPALRSSTQGIDRFLTKNTQVGIRRSHGGHEVYAPHGFDDIADMIVRPNPGPNFSAASYEAKAARWKMRWPEITVLAAGEGIWIGMKKALASKPFRAARWQR